MKTIRSDVEGARDRRRARAYQRRYARRHGYFWLPCPICGDEFGGHEASGSIATARPGEFEAICPSCTAERQQFAERRLAEEGLSVRWLATTRWGARSVTHYVPLRPTVSMKVAEAGIRDALDSSGRPRWAQKDDTD